MDPDGKSPGDSNVPEPADTAAGDFGVNAAFVEEIRNSVQVGSQ